MISTVATLHNIVRSGRALCAAALISAASLTAVAPAQAAGDLLVAPTRIVFDGKRGTEVILNNVGDEEATYRITLELRRMTDKGRLADVDKAEANEVEKAALSVIRYAPRRVTLPPGQPQAIRLGLRGTQELADGEYRAHMLFRAIPKARPVTQQDPEEQGLKIQLIPVYGVTIPIIIRKGKLEATAAISGAKMIQDANGPVLSFDLARKGSKSVYGEIQISRPGVDEPIMRAKGIAVYPELESRKVFLPMRPEQAEALKGPVRIAYYETPQNGGGLIAETQTVIQ